MTNYGTALHLDLHYGVVPLYTGICHTKSARYIRLRLQTRCLNISIPSHETFGGLRATAEVVSRTTMEATRNLIRSVWGVELDDDTERKYSTYLRFCLVQGLDPIEEIEFTIGLLKNNAEAPKRLLKEALEQIRREIAGGITTEQRLNSITSMSGVVIPTITQSVKESILYSTFNINRALAKAAHIMLATDLAMDSKEVSGHSLTVWNDSESLRSIIESTLPRLRASTQPAYYSQSPTSSQIHSTKLRVKYLVDYADVEIVWTRHLPDHLELEGKKLRIFELASYLELSRTAMSDEAGVGLADCLKR